MKTELNAKNFRRLYDIAEIVKYETKGAVVPFVLLDKPIHTKVVTAPIPFETGFAFKASEREAGAFPKYLEAFKDCYEQVPERYWNGYKLKPEFWHFEDTSKRPHYTIEIKYNGYLVEISDEAKAVAKRTVDRYARWIKEWSKLT
jgi:hypothetical protein